MKLKKILTFGVALILGLSTACDLVNSSTSSSSSSSSSNTTSSSSTSSSSSSVTETKKTYGSIPSGVTVLTEAQAIERMKSTEWVQYETICVSGVVAKVSYNSSFGSYTVDLEGGFEIYSGQLGTDVVAPEVGDEIIASGKSKIFTKGDNTTYEIAYDSSHKESPVIHQITRVEKENGGVTLPEAGSKITIAQALEIAEQAGDKGTTDRYLVEGTIVTISNPTYGEMTITDGTDELYVYGTYSSDGEKRYSELDDKPYAGDTVSLLGLLSTYKGEPQMKSGWIQSFEHVEVEYDPAVYPAKTVLEARGVADATKLTVEGVVANVTYANGMIPSGFYVVDGTSSIYVYDRDIAARVEVGNKVKVAGEKDYWILETEQSNAQKFGYTGCIQLTNCILVENDEKTTNEFDKAWIKESTVKKMLETPLSNNITTEIYKVNALVTKNEGKGFVNYYFNDLDGKTGTYTYTQCNGSDFVWLDEFDGKICTVYLSIINAKSTSTGCAYRLMPIAVKDENYTFNMADASQFVLDYYVADQFEDKYLSNPNLEVVTSVSNALLGLENVAVTYASSNTSVINFETVEGKLVMKCVGEGTAKVTATVAHSGVTKTFETEITYQDIINIETSTVAEAYATADDQEVTVKGVVVSSIPNKNTGFFIADETGAIAVNLTSKDELSDIQLGHEVIIKGIKSTYIKTGTTGIAGQINIYNATLVVNLYGEHKYDSTSFDTTKTIADLVAIGVNEVATDKVYRLQGKIKLVSTTFYSNYYVVDPNDSSKEILLYAGNAGQYSFLEDYVDQTVTMDFALCNWNSKTKTYAGHVLAIEVNGEMVVNDCNFQ